MATVAGKRKAPNFLENSEKRFKSMSLNDDEPVTQSYDSNEDGDSYHAEKNESDDDQSEIADTPVTPFSPQRKKFPSELKTIKCTFEGCDKSFNRPARLASHLRSHYNERPFSCSYEGCDKSYIDEKHLKQHIKGSHTHERSYQCNWDGCSKSFLTATRLRRHIEAHEGHDRFRCTEYPPCSQTFRKHQTLQRHIRSDHLELAPYPCTYVDPVTSEPCNAGFDGAAGLRKHEDRVHSLPRFFCPECTLPGINPDGSAIHLGFTTQNQLKSHIKKEHVNCAFCDRKCSSQRELEKHVESQHSGTTLEQRKTIPCTYSGCNKTFTKKYNLNVHIRTQHSGERLICENLYVTETPDLVTWNHEDACGKDFASKANLEDHIRTAHLGLPSTINANRKKPTHSDIDDDDAEFPAKPKKKSKKQKPSAIDELLGESYAIDDRRNIQCIVPSCPHLFIREYDLDQHVRVKHRLSTPEIEQAMEEALVEFEDEPEFEFPPGDARNDRAYGARGDQEDDAEMADAMYEQADMGWELDRMALEGGPFWIGGGEEPTDNGEEWMRDELEMRRLVNGDEVGGFLNEVEDL